jgi:hypothetical protein
VILRLGFIEFWRFEIVVRILETDRLLQNGAGQNNGSSPGSFLLRLQRTNNNGPTGKAVGPLDYMARISGP